MNPERVVAAFFVALCFVFLLRLLLGEQQRARLDHLFRRLLSVAKTPWRAFKRWRMRRAMTQTASKQAQDAIARARVTSVERRGNVYSPGAFKNKRQQDRASDKTQGPGPH